MPLNPQKLANAIVSNLDSEMGDKGRETKKYRRKLAKAIANAIVTNIQSDLQDSNGDSHF